MCRRCIFELAYSIATGRPEPPGKMTKREREAALQLIEKAELKTSAPDPTANRARS